MKPARKPTRPHRPTRSELEAELDRSRRELDDRRGKLELKALQQAQLEVEASRQRFVELYDFAPVGHLSLDHSGVIRTLNQTAVEFLGGSRAALIGRPLLVLVAPRDRRRFLSHLSRLRRGEPHSSVELELRRPKATPVTVQMVSVARALTRSHGLEYHTALVDITERKKAEARASVLAELGLLLSAASDPVSAARALVDTALAFCGWDACFLSVHDPVTDTMTDLVSMDTIKGQRVPVPSMSAGRPPSPLARRVMQEGPQLILRRSPDETGPITRRFGDTTRPSLSLMFVPVRLEGRSVGVLSLQSYQSKAYTPQDLAILQGLADHVAGALARLQAEADLRRVNEQLEARVAERTAELQQYRNHLEELVKQRTSELEAANQQLRQEITSRQGAEEALLRMAEELKRSNLELEQFAYAASHDLQEPLRAVGGYVRLLQLRFPEKLDAKAREYIEGAAEGAVRMEQQITDLLTLSRVGTRGLEVARANLSAPLTAALHNLQFTIKAAKATVTHDPLPVVPVDEGQMVQLFQNLVGNALKFRGEHPPQIHVGARAENGRWVVWVRDNGIGLDPSYAERVFLVFQRLHTRKKYPGTGIGLALCRKIVERHGGKIWVESQLGQGATFYFSLPADSGILEGTA